MGHVNNAVYATYVESARQAFFAEAVGQELATTDAALATLSVEFHAPIYGETDVTVETVVTGIGETSCTFTHRLSADGEHVADAEATLVNLADGEPTPIGSDLRTALERFHTPAGFDGEA